DRPREPGLIDGKERRRDRVLDVDPAHPLAAAAQPAAGEPAKRRRHPGQRALAAEDDPEASAGDADAVGLGGHRLTLPLAAHPGEKAAAGRGLLVDLVL